MKKNIILLIAIAITSVANLYAQDVKIGFGLDHSDIHAKALLELASTTKGFLTPRMTTVQRDAIFSEADANAAGMLVFDTTLNAFYYYTGSVWTPIKSITPVTDNLSSTSTTDALSANQGRLLDEALDDKLAKDVNITLGTKYISNDGTDAGLSFDANNVATFSGATKFNVKDNTGVDRVTVDNS
ncbi:MAG: hypothetical protein GY787_26885, partial [Alteromonadales bacterium]|nr:hypothetical protein [Alteromonadales bacterium]